MNKQILERLYLKDLHPVSIIARKLNVSENKINYWLTKYSIPKRSISEAVYLKKNPKGDPFRFQFPKTKDDLILMGLGVGLYWGEGNKRNKSSLRLGNVDPNLILAYVKFLNRIYCVDKKKLKFGLQIFSDISPIVAKKFWLDKLKAHPSQFHKIVVTPSRGSGNYRNKSEYGVLTVYFNNSRLKKAMDGLIENFNVI